MGRKWSLGDLVEDIRMGWTLLYWVGIAVLKWVFMEGELFIES